jgi:hypothetical protein
MKQWQMRLSLTLSAAPTTLKAPHLLITADNALPTFIRSAVARREGELRGKLNFNLAQHRSRRQIGTGRFPIQSNRFDLRRGILENSVRVPHQAILEFIAAVTRPIRGYVILPLADALREAEELLLQFPVLYPNESEDVRRTSSAGWMRTSGHMQNITACPKSSRNTYSTSACMAQSEW